MRFDLNCTEVSDEALFLLMTQGNKQASTILFRRYEFLGRQMSGVRIRQCSLYGCTDENFVETIHDNIMKSFRYYQLNQSRFMTFCRNNLEQGITERSKELALEKEKEKQTVNLDAEIKNDCSSNYHEIIGDQRNLTYSQLADLNNFVERMSSHSNPEFRLYTKVLLCNLSGMSVQEIAKTLGITVYKARRVLEKKYDLQNDELITIK